MKLSIWKCHSFLFTLYHHDPKPCIVINDTQLSHGSTPQHNSLKLLIVHLNTLLTMKIHHNHLIRQCATCLHQLSHVSNSIYGLDQVDLRTMYIAYICSILEYAAPVWSPCMSKTSLATLQHIQNQASRTILEYDKAPTLMHFILKQAYHHCKHDMTLQLHFVLKNTVNTPLDDPLYQIAHQTLPPAHLK